jgi:hypothetical protein
MADTAGCLRKQFPKPTFEPFIHLIDLTCSLAFSREIGISVDGDKSRDLFTKSIVGAFLDLHGGKLEDWSDCRTVRLPSLIRNYILDYVKDHHPVSSADSVDCWVNAIRKLKHEFDEVSIYSLNYDALMPTVVHRLVENGVSIETGFGLGMSTGQPRVFAAAQFYAADCVFAPLHGSIHFSESQNGGGVQFMQDLFLASENRSTGPGFATFTPEEGINFNVSMISGLSKFKAFEIDPYQTYYRRLSKDLVDCQKILIIGYGGADPHLKTLLDGKLMEGKQFIVVTKLADQSTGDLATKQMELLQPTIDRYLPFGVQTRAKLQNTRIHLTGAGEFLTRLLNSTEDLASLGKPYPLE